MRYLVYAAVLAVASSAFAEDCVCPDTALSSRTFVTYLYYAPTDELIEILVDDIDGKAVLGGDVILGSAAEWRTIGEYIKKRGGAGAATQILKPADARVLQFMRAHKSSITPWPNNTVPYTYGSSINKSMRKKVRAAMDDWSAGTGLKFVARKKQKRYIRFTLDTNGVCFWDGSQANVGSGCARHEIGHALGLRHEHTRSDRNASVEIQWKNIDNDHCSQFDRVKSTAGLCGPYDFKSVMHYTKSAFTCNGKVTIKALNGNTIQKDPFKISAGDFLAVKAIHGLATCP